MIMSKKDMIEVNEYANPLNPHSDAGQSYEITCPECGDDIVVSEYGWGSTVCSCGRNWKFEVKFSAFGTKPAQEVVDYVKEKYGHIDTLRLYHIVHSNSAEEVHKFWNKFPGRSRYHFEYLVKQILDKRSDYNKVMREAYGS